MDTERLPTSTPAAGGGGLGVNDWIFRVAGLVRRGCPPARWGSCPSATAIPPTSPCWHPPTSQPPPICPTIPPTHPPHPPTCVHQAQAALLVGRQLAKGHQGRGGGGHSEHGALRQRMAEQRRATGQQVSTCVGEGVQNLKGARRRRRDAADRKPLPPTKPGQVMGQAQDKPASPKTNSKGQSTGTTSKQQ